MSQGIWNFAGLMAEMMGTQWHCSGEDILNIRDAVIHYLLNKSISQSLTHNDSDHSWRIHRAARSYAACYKWFHECILKSRFTSKWTSYLVDSSFLAIYSYRQAEIDRLHKTSGPNCRTSIIALFLHINEPPWSKHHCSPEVVFSRLTASMMTYSWSAVWPGYPAACLSWPF